VADSTVYLPSYGMETFGRDTLASSVSFSFNLIYKHFTTYAKEDM